MEKNIKNIRKEFKSKGIFYTTLELAMMLKSYVDFVPTKIYDPTCGQGNLLSVFPDEIEKYGQEIYSEELQKASRILKNFHGYCGDTLTDDGFDEMKFDLIVANPPFSITWIPNHDDKRFKSAPTVPTASKADYAFILHILHHLENKGKAICLEFPGILYRGNREGEIRKWLIDNNWIERVVAIPGNTFADTTISTCILIFNKAKENTDIVFEDRESGEELIVPYEQIVENSYILSVSSYIFPQEEKEAVDPMELEIHARKNFIQRLDKELAFEKTVCEMEQISIHPFILEIKKAADRYDDKELKNGQIKGQLSFGGKG